MNEFICTKSSEEDLKFKIKGKALMLLHSGKVGENFWKKEFLFSYKLSKDKNYLNKGIFSIFTFVENKDKNIIQTGKFYELEIICNAKKNKKGHWVNNLDIVSVKEITKEDC